MKIGVTSDIHLEFGNLKLENKDNIDVLILGGDIAVASKIQTFIDFFKSVSEQFPNTIYIMGNHEHYSGLFDRTEKNLRDHLEQFSNIHILEKSTKKIGDVTFVGQTLWTDFNNRDPLTLWHCGRMMNDYHTIRLADRQYKKLTTDDTLREHEKSLQYLKYSLSTLKDEKVVVVGHHAPSNQSLKPGYEDDSLMNGAYHSDLSEFILEHPQIKLWTHGHTHNEFDYMIGTTRVVCNPRGYWMHEIFEPGYTYQIVEV